MRYFTTFSVAPFMSYAYFSLEKASYSERGRAKPKVTVITRDVILKIAFLIIGGKAQKAEVSLQRRLCISTSAFLKLVSVP